ncbi:MAG: tyrosine-type recombinase/integrase [Alphaproteobacteria bacterium]
MTDDNRTFAATAERWLAHQQRMVEGRRITASTLDGNRKSVRVLAREIGDKPIAAFTRIDADNYAAARTAAGLRGATVNRELKALRSILMFASEIGLLDQDPPRVRPVPTASTEAELPDTAAIRAVVDRMPRQHRNPLLFSAMTGLSWHEVCRLRWCDIDWWRKLINVGRRDSFTVKTAARIRSIPMTKEIESILRSQQATVDAHGDQPVFPAAAATRQALLRERRHDEPEVSPSMMRKLFAATLAARNVPEAQLQRLLGHAPGSKVTRKHYVRSQAAMLAAAMALGGRVL